MTSDTHVRLTNLTRSFHEGEQLHAVLQSLDATFIRDEKVALRGRSGSGKSTLLNLISGIDVQPVIDDQELNATVRYWEGAVNVSGKRNGEKLGGRGYVELTGYAGITEPE